MMSMKCKPQQAFDHITSVVFWFEDATEVYVVFTLSNADLVHDKASMSAGQLWLIEL